VISGVEWVAEEQERTMPDRTNSRRPVLIIAALVAVGMIGCASTELAYYDFGNQNVSVDARVAPDARVDSSYSVQIDPNDPVKTAISIGSSLAKADQVRDAEQKLDEALRGTDLAGIVEDELGEFVESAFGSRIVEDRHRADMQLMVQIDRYGIDASGSGVDFKMTAVATLWDLDTGDRIWRGVESVTEPVSPDVFGLPGSAGNVLSAVALSGLSPAEIRHGIERIARDAAWDVGLNLERDIYRARSRR
jgi:hypothetical protein